MKNIVRATHGNVAMATPIPIEERYANPLAPLRATSAGTKKVPWQTPASMATPAPRANVAVELLSSSSSLSLLPSPLLLSSGTEPGGGHSVSGGDDDDDEDDDDDDDDNVGGGEDVADGISKCNSGVVSEGASTPSLSASSSMPRVPKIRPVNMITFMPSTTTSTPHKVPMLECMGAFKTSTVQKSEVTIPTED